MIYADPNLEAVTKVVKRCLTTLYKADTFLFQRNDGKGVCERGMVFRFAHYLQNELDGYYVDCDFNSSFVIERAADGQLLHRERTGKEIQNEDGTATKRYIDIIVHKRDYNSNNDYICFEFKKWHNNKGIDKDINNLKQLTSQYHYQYGFLITFGSERNKSKWRVFNGGKELLTEQLIFGK